MSSYPIVRYWKLTPPHRYKYLWLKYLGINGVDDVDLSKHCQECLGGIKSRKFSLGAKNGYTETPPIVLDEISTNVEFFYLCGGTWEYAHNLHIAFRYKQGSTVEVKTPREHWIIDNAERIPILESYVNKDDPNYGNDEYQTCRNWWFAHHIKKQLAKGKKKGRLPGFLF